MIEDKGWQSYTRDQIYDELEEYITKLEKNNANLEEVFSFINGVWNNRAFNENEKTYLEPYSSAKSIKEDLLSNDKATENDLIGALIQGLTQFKKQLTDVIADRNRPGFAQLSPPPQNIFISADEIGPRGLEIFKKAGIEITHKVKNIADDKCEKILQCKAAMTMEDVLLFHEFIHDLKLNQDAINSAFLLKSFPSIFIKRDKLSSIEAMEKAFRGKGYENLSKLIESNKDTLDFNNQTNTSYYCKRANLITAIALGVKDEAHIKEMTSIPGSISAYDCYASSFKFGFSGSKKEGINKYLPDKRITRNDLLDKLMMESMHNSINKDTKQKIIEKFWELHNRSYEFAKNKKPEEKKYSELSISISTKGDSYMQSLAFQEFDSLNANSYQKDLHWDANDIQNPEFDSIFPADDSVFTKGTNIRNNLKTMIRLTEEELKAYSPKLRQHIENTKNITDVRDRMLNIFKLMQEDAIKGDLPPLIMLGGAGCQFEDSQEDFINNMIVLGAKDSRFTVHMGNKFFKKDTLNASSFSPIYSVKYLKTRINNNHHFFHNGVGYNFISDLGELGYILDPENIDNSGPVKLKDKNIENFKKIEPNKKKYLETRLKLIRNEGCLPFGDLLLKEDEAEKDKVTKDKVTNYKVISLDEDSEQKEIMQVKIGAIKGQNRLRVFNTIIEEAAKNIEDILRKKNIQNKNSLEIVQAFILSIAEYNYEQKTFLGVTALREKEDFLELLNNNIMLMGIKDVTLDKELAKTVSGVIQLSGAGLSNTISGKIYESNKSGEIKKGARTHRLAKAMLQQYGSIDAMKKSFGSKLEDKVESRKGIMSLNE